MSHVSVSKESSGGWPVLRVGRWLVDAWQLFRDAPFRLYALAVLPMLVEVTVQFGWPTGGVVLSKLVVPVVSAWALLMAHGVLTRNRAEPGAALHALWHIRRSLPGLALLSASVFVFQVIVMALLVGPAGAMALIVADPASVAAFTRLDVAISLAAGAIPAIAVLFFAGTRIVLDGVPVVAAVRENLHLLRRNPAALLSWTVVNFGLLLALVYQPWLLLLLLPMGLVAYAAWRDVFGAARDA